MNSERVNVYRGRIPLFILLFVLLGDDCSLDNVKSFTDFSHQETNLDHDRDKSQMDHRRLDQQPNDQSQSQNLGRLIILFQLLHSLEPVLFLQIMFNSLNIMYSISYTQF